MGRKRTLAGYLRFGWKADTALGVATWLIELATHSFGDIHNHPVSRAFVSARHTIEAQAVVLEPDWSSPARKMDCSTNAACDARPAFVAKSDVVASIGFNHRLIRISAAVCIRIGIAAEPS